MLTYFECLELTKKKNRKKLENNTYLQKFIDDNNDIAFSVILHKTNVVNIYKNGEYELFTGGWYTLTTKSRINAYSPAKIFQQKGEWYIAKSIQFKEGIRQTAEYFDLLRKCYG